MDEGHTWSPRPTNPVLGSIVKLNTAGCRRGGVCPLAERLTRTPVPRTAVTGDVASSTANGQSAVRT